MPQPEPPHAEPDTAPYRGRDRRALLSAHQAPTGRPFFIAGFGLVALAVFVFTAAQAAVSTDTAERMQSIAASFELSAGALGVVAATLCVVLWRLSGDARALWIGTAVGTYAVFSVALTQLLPAVGPRNAAVGAVRPASLIVALVVFAWALRSPEIDARLRPTRTFLLATLGFLAVLAVVAAVPGVSELLAPSDGAQAEARAAVLIALAWVGFAVAYILRGLRAGRLLFAWYGLTMFGLTLAELARAIALDSPSAATGEGDLLLGSAIIRAIALLYGVVGVMRDLQSLFANQSSRLLKTMVDTMASNASLQAAKRQREELAHEARNALTAIEGATRTLERFRETLDDDTRSALAVAVSDEIGRLQRLVGSTPTTGHAVSFRLADLVEPQVGLQRAQGAHLTTRVPGDAVAFGRPGEFAEVLQNLLVNARVHGRGPIVVTARAHDGTMDIVVEDRGPGVPGELHEAIFERGRRASDHAGSGLGLYLSRKLMREQGGDLRVEDREGGGARFVATMLAAEAAAAQSVADSGRDRAVAQHGGD